MEVCGFVCVRALSDLTQTNKIDPKISPNLSAIGCRWRRTLFGIHLNGFIVAKAAVLFHFSKAWARREMCFEQNIRRRYSNTQRTHLSIFMFIPICTLWLSTPLIACCLVQQMKSKRNCFASLWDTREKCTHREKKIKTKNLSLVCRRLFKSSAVREQTENALNVAKSAKTKRSLVL